MNEVIKDVHKGLIMGVFGETFPGSTLNSFIHQVDRHGVGIMQEETFNKLMTECFWMRRHELENLPANETMLRHVIPYIVFYRRVGEEFEFFAYRRNETIGEKGLIGKCSIGFGGHVDISKDLITSDFALSPQASLLNTIGEELSEEVDLDDYDIGYNNIDGPQIIIMSRVDEVACRHLGIVTLVEVTDPELIPECKEDELTSIGWASVEELSNFSNLEPWSKFILIHMSNNLNLLDGHKPSVKIYPSSEERFRF